MLGAIDLCDLAFAAGLNPSVAGLPTIPLGAWVDKVTLINDNSANAWAWGFLGDTSEAPTGFVARRETSRQCGRR